MILCRSEWHHHNKTELSHSRLMTSFSSKRELWIIETIWNILSTENSWNSWYHFVWQISTFMHFNSEIQKLFAANLKSQGCKWIYIFKNLFSQAPNINVHKTAVILIPLNSCNTAGLGHFNLFNFISTFSTRLIF